MSYLVLARKYRPQTFEGLVGQEHVTATLRNAIASGRIAHAFLFCGIRGVGKTTAARLLAKALNCENGPTAEPCNECSNCQEIAASTSVDVAEIDGASNRGIDSIRDLNDAVRYLPAKSRFRIYIIDEAHMVTREGFNALLKTLEEPPRHVKFIFATTAPDKFPETILSRCQRYDFRRISTQEIAAHLREIAGRENVKIAEAALYLVAREAEGSMRDAESVLDRLIAFSGAEIDEARVAEVLGVADRTALRETVDAVLASDPKRALTLLDGLYEAGRDLERFVRDLLEHFRNLVVVRVHENGDLLREVPPDEVKELQRQAGSRPLEDLQRMFRIVLRGEWEVRTSPTARLVLEMMLVRLATLEPAVPVEDLLARLEGLEGRLGGAGGPVPAPARPAPERRSSSGPGRTVRGAPATARPEASEATPSAAPSTASVDEPPPTPPPSSAPSPPPSGNGDWTAFLDFVRGRRITIYMNLSHARILSHDGGVLSLGVAREHFLKELAHPETVRLLGELATEFYGVATAVSVEGSRETDAAASPVRRALENDMVKMAVEILEGEVREVKPLRRNARKD